MQELVDLRYPPLLFVRAVECLEQNIAVFHERGADEDSFFFFQHEVKLIKMGLLVALALAGEIVLLTRGSENGVPERSVRIDLLSFVHGVFDRHVAELFVHAAHHHVGLARHTCVHGAFCKLEAEDGVGSLRGDAAHHVARVEILDVHFLADFLEVFVNFAREEFADVVLQNVSARVAAFFLVLEEFLPGAFCNGDDRVRLAAAVAAFERLEESFQRERYFGNEAEVHDGRCKGCVGGDKARVAAHELHETEPVERSVRFVVRARNHVGRGEHRRLETERAVDEVQVVVDGFRDADDRDGLAALLHFFGDGVCPAQRAVTADAEQHVDVEAHEGVHHDGGFLHAARTPEDGAAVFLDGVDDIRVQYDGRVAVGGVESAVAVGDAENVPDAVVEPEHLNEALDDVVEAGAEATAGDDSRACPCGVVEDGLARACRFERGDCDSLLVEFADALYVRGKADAVFFRYELDALHGRLERACTDRLDGEVVLVRILENVFLCHSLILVAFTGPFGGASS